MKVKELLEILNKFNPEAELFSSNWPWGECQKIVSAEKGLFYKNNFYQDLRDFEKYGNGNNYEFENTSEFAVNLIHE